MAKGAAYDLVVFGSRSHNLLDDFAWKHDLWRIEKKSHASDESQPQ